MKTEKKILEFDVNGDNKVSKAELALKMIEMKNEIKDVGDHAEHERRKMKKDFDRKIREVKVLTLGNKKDIKTLYRRTDDNVDHIEKLQGYVQWTIKTILGLLITLVLTGVLGYVFKLF